MKLQPNRLPAGADGPFTGRDEHASASQRSSRALPTPHKKRLGAHAHQYKSFAALRAVKQLHAQGSLRLIRSPSSKPISETLHYA